MFRRALICTDFSDGLYRLTQVVPSLVTGGLQQLTFFHNVPLQTDRGVPQINKAEMAAAQNRLEQALGPIPDPASVSVEVMSGRPQDNILALVESTGADVVFLGMPTRNLLTEKLFGSTTMGLVERLQVPVMILRPQLISTYTTPELELRCRSLFQYLLVPYDGEETSERLLQRIQMAVEQSPERVLQRCLILWVVDESIRPELRCDQATAETKLAEASAGLRDLGVMVETLVKQGDPQAELFKVAENRDISAIAVFSSHKRGLQRWSVPSFTREILRCSWHPVLDFPEMT
ncbi:MAG: universal stress protein [Leptolyngbya sp. RL_3_1]|nr:universal stress protein [Leptolyngbya sp. RL_3_1]